MRYAAIALVALVISVPAAALAGPDALSIAKRALRLAKEPPAVRQIYSEDTVPRDEPHLVEVVARCPHRMVAISILPYPGPGETVDVSLTGHRGAALFRVPDDYPNGPSHPAVKLTCLEGRLISPG